MVEKWFTGKILHNQDGVLRGMLSSMLSEGGEELIGSVTNDLTDTLLMPAITGGKSKWTMEAEDLMDQNPEMSAKEAYSKVFENHLMDAIVAAASGAASGGVMTGPVFAVQGGANMYSNWRSGRDMLRNNNVVAAPAAQSLEGDVAAPGNVQAPQNVVQPTQTVDAAQISQGVSESAMQLDANAAEMAGVQDEVTEGNRERGRSRLEQARANAAEAQARMEQAAQDMAAGNATQEDVDAAADELTQARLEERRAEVEAQRNEVTEGNRQRARERGAQNRSQGETQTEEAQDRGGVVDNNNGRAPVNVSTGLRSAMDLAMRLEGSEAATYAQQLQADIDKGRTVSARKAGKLMRLLQEHNVNGVSEAARGINQNAL